jgi:two-component system cell cycle response regulator CtrA
VLSSRVRCPNNGTMGPRGLIGAQNSGKVGGRTFYLGNVSQMLELLSLRKGTTLTKEMFLNHLYGGMDEPELKIIDVFICKLRKKLCEATMEDSYIETVWGRGYVLRDPIDAEQVVPQSAMAG